MLTIIVGIIYAVMQYATSRVEFVLTMIAETEWIFDDRSIAIIAVHTCAASNPQCKNTAINLHPRHDYAYERLL